MTLNLPFAAIILAHLVCSMSAGQQPFADVPPDHWAAECVQQLKEQGIVTGYPDGRFLGDKPVTRYELAVLLVRFTQVLSQSTNTQVSLQNSQQGHIKKTQTKAAKQNSSGVRQLDEPAKVLFRNGFIPQTSPLLNEPNKQVTAQELADTLAWIAKRFIELKVPESDQEVERKNAQPSANDN